MACLCGDEERIPYGVRTPQTTNHHWTKELHAEPLRHGCIIIRVSLSRVIFVCSPSLETSRSLLLYHSIKLFLKNPKPETLLQETQGWDWRSRKHTREWMCVWTRGQKGSSIGPLELPSVKELQSCQLRCWVLCVQLLQWWECAQAFSLYTASLGQENCKPASCTRGQFPSVRDIFVFHM